MQRDAVRGSRPSSAVSTVLAVATVLASSAAAVLAVLSSPYGSLLFMDDQFGIGSVLVPLCVGAVVGMLQTSAFGMRLTVGTVGVATLAVSATLVLAFPAVMHLVGVTVGALVVSHVRPRTNPPRRAAVLALAGLTVVALALGLTRTQAEPAPLVDLVERPGQPTVVLDPQRRAPEILDPVTGVLADVGGCLGLETRDGAQRFVVFWPDDLEVLSAPFTVVRDGRTYGLGDRLTIAGAVLDRRLGDAVYYADGLPDGCEPYDVLMT